MTLHQVRTALVRLGKPDAINWVTFVAVALLQITGSLITSLVDFNGREWEFLLVRLVSVLLLFAVLTLGRLVLVHTTQSRPRPVITLVVFAAAVVVGTASFDAGLLLTGLTDESRLWPRLQVSGTGLISVLILTAILVTYSRDFDEKNRSLVSAVEELRATRNEASARITQRKAKLVQSIHDQIYTEIARIRQSDPQALPDQLKSLVDDVVRPVSYRLNRTVDFDETEHVRLTSGRVPWPHLVRDAFARNPVHPLATGLWLGAITASFLVPNFKWAGLAGAAAYTIATISILFVAKFAWRVLPGRLPVAGGITLFVVTNSSAVACSAWFVSLITGFDVLTPPRFWPLIVVGLVVATTVTLVATANRLLRETNDALTSTVDELKREVIELNNSYRLLQKGVSAILHGPVQEAILSTVFRLQRLDASADTSTTLLDLSRRIDASLDQMNDATAQSVDLEAEFADLVELWDDVIEITVDCPRETRQFIESDSFAAYAVNELTRESIGNAIRHGDAKHALVRVRVDPVIGAVDLHIANDGAPLPADARAGMGSQMFEELCLTWHRRQVEDRVQTDAQIPLRRVSQPSTAR